jgi:hypothetical protein
MMRLAAIPLGLLLAAGGALAASPEAVYLAARDKARAVRGARSIGEG